MLQEVYRLIYAILRKEFGEDVTNQGEGRYELVSNGQTYRIIVWSLDTRRPSDLRRLGDLPEHIAERIKGAIDKYTVGLEWAWIVGHLQCLTPTVPFEVAYLDS